MDYTKLTIAEIANGISKTEAAIRRCREILDDLREPKTVGMQAVVKAIRDLLPKLEEDLKALGESLHPRHQAQRLGAALIAYRAISPPRPPRPPPPPPPPKAAERRESERPGPTRDCRSRRCGAYDRRNYRWATRLD
jgi:hypothetical protein